MTFTCAAHSLSASERSSSASQRRSACMAAVTARLSSPCYPAPAHSKQARSQYTKFSAILHCRSSVNGAATRGYEVRQESSAIADIDSGRAPLDSPVREDFHEKSTLQIVAGRGTRTRKTAARPIDEGRQNRDSLRRSS